MAEIAFEHFAIGTEPTRGQVASAFSLVAAESAILKPVEERYEPEESTNTLANLYRSAPSKRWSEWSAEGPLDINLFLLFAKMCLTSEPVTLSETPVKVIEFKREIRRDNLKSATIIWGDPGVEVFQTTFAMLDELSISFDATGSDGATMSAGGLAHYPKRLGSEPAVIASIGELSLSPLITVMRVWMDRDDYGLTELKGKVLSAEHTLPTGMTYKYYGNRELTFERTGRKPTHPETKVVFEFDSAEEYALYESNIAICLRVAHEGPEIGDTGQYYSVAFDAFGPLAFEDWGTHEDSNRTIEFMIRHHYDASLQTDLRVTVTTAPD